MAGLLNDEYFMRAALRQAEQAANNGEVPIGAVIVHNDQIIARGSNQVEMLKDGTAHAEMIAITQASAELGAWRLTGATLYVTKEPCPMCIGAMVNSRIDKVVYGISDPRAGGIETFAIHNHPGLLHAVEVEKGLLQEECLFVMQDFFRRRRQENKSKKKLGNDNA